MSLSCVPYYGVRITPTLEPRTRTNGTPHARQVFVGVQLVETHSRQEDVKRHSLGTVRRKTSKGTVGRKTSRGTVEVSRKPL